MPRMAKASNRRRPHRAERSPGGNLMPLHDKTTSRRRSRGHRPLTVRSIGVVQVLSRAVQLLGLTCVCILFRNITSVFDSAVKSTYIHFLATMSSSRPYRTCSIHWARINTYSDAFSFSLCPERHRPLPSRIHLYQLYALVS